MGIRSSLPLLVAMTAALHNLSVPPGVFGEVNSRENSSSANHFWQSVDLEESTGSLEWMLKDDHHVSSAKQQEPSTERIAQKTPNSSSSKRSLRQIKKEHMDDFHWPSTAEEKHRLLIRCKADQEQEGCVSDLFRRSKNRNPIKIVHNLKAINALSIEVDSETRDVLFADDFDLHRDFERAPLVEREEPLTDETRRKLQDGQQEGWGLRTVRAKQVWDVYGVRGGGVKVCILDTGLDVDHEDFVELTVDGYIGEEAVEPWYEDRRGHGTHITGIIAASDNNLGTLGIAPDVDAFVVKVFDDERHNFHGFSEGTVYSTDLIAAAQVCKEAGADIINASLGGYNYDQFEDEFFRSLYENDGIITIAAAGNGGDERNVYPAGYDSVFSVSAANEAEQVADFASLNPTSTDILAPGVGILSTYVGNAYRSFSGSSMAAPHATGVIALMLSYIRTFRSNASYRDVLHILRATARKESDTTSSRGGEFGHIGVIDAYAAVEALANGLQDGFSLLEAENDPSHCNSEVRLEVSTDDKGFETAYRLKNLDDGSTIWMEPPNVLDSNSHYSELTCLETTNACFRFDIRDIGGDGIQGDGVKLYFKGHELYHGGSFGGGGMLKFGDNC